MALPSLPHLPSFTQAHGPLLRLYLTPWERLRRAGALLAAQTSCGLAEAGLLVATLATAGSPARWLLGGWVAASAGHCALDYHLRRCLAATADAGTATVWQHLDNVAARQRGAHHGGSTPILPDAQHLGLHVEAVHNAVKHHLPFLAIDALTAATSTMAAVVVAAATGSGWAVGLVLAGACGVALVGHRWLLARAQQAAQLQHAHRHQLLKRWARLTDGPTAEFLRRCGLNPHERRLLRQAAHDQQRAGEQAQAHRLRSGMLTRGLTQVVMVAAVAFTLRTGSTMVGLPVVFLLTVQALHALMRLPDNLQALTQALPSSLMVSRTLSLPARIAESRHLLPLPPNARSTISARDVCLRYPNGTQALSGINLEVAPGEVLVLTGAVGSGKTTLLRALCRLEQVQHGYFALAGVPLHLLSFADVDAAVVLMPAQTHLEPVSLLDNVRAANPTCSAEQAEQALLVAGWNPADPPAARVDCTGLSSGQARIVELARMLVHPAAVKLFDEPTANLDPQTVARFPHVVQHLRASGTTVIIATHHPEVVATATSHLHLQEGRLTPVPTPAAPCPPPPARNPANWVSLPLHTAVRSKPLPLHNRSPRIGHTVMARRG